MGGPFWVMAVNLLIWAGLCFWLFRLDRRIRDLERQR